MGNNYNLVASFTPNAGTTTFNGQANASSRVVTITITENGNPFYSTTYTDYYLLNPNWTPLGTTWPSGTPYLLVNSGSFQELPATINVGDSGPVFNATYYHNNSNPPTQDATLAVTYSVSAHNANNLNFCLEFDIPSASVTAQGTSDGIVPGSQTYCFHVDAAGNANLNSWTVYNADTGVTLTF